MKRQIYIGWLMVVLLFVGMVVGCLGPKTSPVPTTPPIEEPPVPGVTPVPPTTAGPTPALPCEKCYESPFMWPVADGLFKWAFRDKSVCYWPCIPAFGHQGIDIYASNTNATPGTVPVYAVADGEVVYANIYSLRLKVSVPEAYWGMLNFYNAIDPDEKHAFGPGQNEVHVYYTHMANRSCDISYVDPKFRSGEFPIKVKQGDLLGYMGVCRSLEPSNMHLHISVNRLYEDSRERPYKVETEEGSGTFEYNPNYFDYHSYDPTPYFGMALHMNHLPTLYPVGTSHGVSHICNYKPETWIDKIIPKVEAAPPYPLPIEDIAPPLESACQINAILEGGDPSDLEALVTPSAQLGLDGNTYRIPLRLDQVREIVTAKKVTVHGWRADFPIPGSLALFTSGWDELWPGGMGWIEIAEVKGGYWKWTILTEIPDYTPDIQQLLQSGQPLECTVTPHPVSPTITSDNADQVVELARLGRGILNDIAVSPDGKGLAVASSIGVWLYDLETLKSDRLLEGHKYGVHSVAWSPDGTRLASLGGEGTVRVWDVATGQQLHVLEGHSRALARGSVAWSPDGTRLASANGYYGDNLVRVWDAVAGRQVTVMKGHLDNVWSVAWSPDGTRLASGSHDDTVRIWDAANGSQLHAFEDGPLRVQSVAWSPDGTQLASGGGDGLVRVWDVASGDELRMLAGHTGWILRIAWSPDGTEIASTSNDNTVRIWDAASGQQLHVLEGHSVNVWSVAWLPNGMQLVSGDVAGNVWLWDVTSGSGQRMLGGYTQGVFAIAWTPDGRCLASAGEGGTVRVWDVASGVELNTLEGSTFRGFRRIFSLSWSPDSMQLALGGTGGLDGSVHVWEVSSEQQLGAMKDSKSSVWSLAWSSDGTLLVSGGDAGTVQVWDVASGQSLHELKVDAEYARSVVWSLDGAELKSVGSDGIVRFWNAVSGEQLIALEAPVDSVSGAAWSPDNTRLALGDRDSVVRVWNPDSGQLMQVMEGEMEMGSVSSVAWSPDGTLLAFAGWDDTIIEVWDAENGGRLQVLKGHTDSIHSVAWSPDGKLLASGSGDGTVRLWGISAGSR